MNEGGILDQCYLHESRFYLLSGVTFLEVPPQKFSYIFDQCLKFKNFFWWQSLSISGYKALHFILLCRFECALKWGGTNYMESFIESTLFLFRRHLLISHLENKQRSEEGPSEDRASKYRTWREFFLTVLRIKEKSKVSQKLRDGGARFEYGAWSLSPMQ